MINAEKRHIYNELSKKIYTLEHDNGIRIKYLEKYVNDIDFKQITILEELELLKASIQKQNQEIREIKELLLEIIRRF